MSFPPRQSKALEDLRDLARLRNAAAMEVKQRRDAARQAGDRDAEIAAKKMLVELSRVNLFIANSRRSVLASTNLAGLNDRLRSVTSRGRAVQGNLKAVSSALNSLANMVRILTKLGNIFA